MAYSRVRLRATRVWRTLEYATTKDEYVSYDCSLLSGSLALEALLISVHCNKRYINV